MKRAFSNLFMHLRGRQGGWENGVEPTPMSGILASLGKIFRPDRPFKDVTEAVCALQRVCRFLEVRCAAEFVGERVASDTELEEVCFVDAK